MEGLTGVISRSESASVADVAASIRSSHLLPIAAAAAAPGGSAENAFLPSILNLPENSFDLVFSCLGLRLFWVIEDFRGLLPFSFLCIDSFLCSGGKVVERPGGECAIIEGSNSRGLGEWNGGIDCLLRWFWMGGSSIEGRIGGRLTSFSEALSCDRTTVSCDSRFRGDPNFCERLLTASESQSEWG